MLRIQFSSDEGSLCCASTLIDRKSTRLNSSHSQISYAVFCLKKKNAPRRERMWHKLIHEGASYRIEVASRRQLELRILAPHPPGDGHHPVTAADTGGKVRRAY